MRWDRWFLAIGAPFGVLLLVLLPPANSADEAHHLARIDQIARGHLVAPRNADHFATARVDGCLNGFVTRLADSMFDKHWRPADAMRRYGCVQAGTMEISNVSLNAPVSYGPAVAGYVVGRFLGGVLLAFWLARIFGLISYLAICWLAVRTTPVGKPFLVLIALLPTPVMLATTLSADPVPISLGLLAVALVLRLRVPRSDEGDPDPTGWLLASFAGCLVLLALSKNLYAVAGLLALLVPRERFSSPRRRWEYVVGVLAAITAEFLAWTLLVLNRVRVVVPFLLDDSFVQREWVRSHPVDFARIAVHSAFGTMLIPTHTWPTTIANTRPALGRTAVAPPAVSLIALGLAVLALAMSRTRPGTSAGRRRTTFDRAAVYVVPLVILLTVLALVLYGEALTFTPPLASGVRITFVEGRFFLPVLGVFLLPFSRSTQCETHDGRTWVGRAGWTVLIGSVGIAVWSLAWLIDTQY
jgi:uncharacterized membrane protein